MKSLNFGIGTLINLLNVQKIEPIPLHYTTALCHCTVALHYTEIVVQILMIIYTAIWGWKCVLFIYIKQETQIKQESGTLMHILGNGEHTLRLEQLYYCLFQPLYTVHV